MPRPERNVRRQVLAYLKTQCCYVTSIVAGPYGRRGAPDLIVCARKYLDDGDHPLGLFVAIETKAPKGVQSPIQRAVQQEIEGAGGVYLLANNVKVVKDWFEGRG